MKFSEDFGHAIEAAMTPAHAAAAMLYSRVDLPKLAPHILLNQYHVVRATPGLLALAWSCAGEESIAAWFRKKESEEEGHDALGLADVVHAGGNPNAAPDPNIVAMVGSQAYLIEHVSPWAFLGYIGILEWFPPTTAAIEGLEDCAKLERGSLTLLRAHAQADVWHREELAAMLDTAPEQHRQAILSNAMHSAMFQTLALENILSKPVQEVTT